MISLFLALHREEYLSHLQDQVDCLNPIVSIMSSRTTSEIFNRVTQVFLVVLVISYLLLDLIPLAAAGKSEEGSVIVISNNGGGDC